MSIRSLLAVAVSIAAIGLSSGAQAASPAATTSDANPGWIRVSLAGLDLGATTGGRIALQRIRAAAAEVCGGAPQTADLEHARLYHACVADVVGHTVATLGSPIVAELNVGAPAPEQTASR